MDIYFNTRTDRKNPTLHHLTPDVPPAKPQLNNLFTSKIYTKILFRSNHPLKCQCHKACNFLRRGGGGAGRNGVGEQGRGSDLM